MLSSNDRAKCSSFKAEFRSLSMAIRIRFNSTAGRDSAMSERLSTVIQVKAFASRSLLKKLYLVRLLFSGEDPQANLLADP